MKIKFFMKSAVILVIILCFVGGGWTGELKRVEKLTDQEKQKLSEAQQKLSEAQRNLSTIEDEIAKNHKMSCEARFPIVWFNPNLEDLLMEWGSWYEINGDYILYYWGKLPNHTEGSSLKIR